MKKLIIIPAYNEESNIVKTVTAIQKDAKDFVYVIINDCSTDRTRQICEEKKYNIVNLIIKILYYILLNLCKIVIFEYILTEKIDLLPKILLILD